MRRDPRSAPVGAPAPPAAMAAAALAISLFAAGCGSSPEPPSCPRVAVIGDAATLTRFAPGPGRDLLDVDYRAEIADVRSGCVYATTDAGDKKLVVAVAPVIIAARGPANENRKADFSYFVSVIDGARAILNKQVFALDVVFPGNTTRLEIRQDDPPVSVDLPIGDDGRERYEILLGLQLSEDELDDNRRRVPLP